MNNEIKRVEVWSGWLRLSHLLIGLSTLLLLATGKLIQNSPMLATNAVDIHYYTAGFMAIGLLMRIVLMFVGQANEKIGNLIPKANELRVIGETIRFYALLGKAPLPRWYAQNPLWKPIYLAVYLILFLQIATGLLMPKDLLFMGFYPPPIHLFWADLLLAFTLLHIICVIWHDYKRGGNDVSAIINGVKTFTIDRPTSTGNGEQPINFKPLKSPYSGKK
jgi:Ni/Fe-hydrogenase 1 B-type cytochrome subunit